MQKKTDPVGGPCPHDVYSQHDGHNPCKKCYDELKTYPVGEQRVSDERLQAISAGQEFGFGDLTSIRMARELLQYRTQSAAAAEEKEKYRFLRPDFLEAMNDIGRYGHEKYGKDSFHHRAGLGDTSRGDMERTTSYAIAEHARIHFCIYLDGINHDYFGTRKHQLAAAAFNAMMEAFFDNESLAAPAAAVEEEKEPDSDYQFFDEFKTGGTK